ncbi:dihydrodipicolinate synthase family protein [Neobacillus sp. PS3-12]|jgi:N-acetylneuraminate lyase|uniref:dihydrodipicolinate synthase family protein n=1 Tax=Neobacillus sp. PS3-12 TaxID=3070677 RepID=UPI0027DF5A43|nr:dihydrodipicolinate synthase family protein [Neobacillus sp. PS3-12]WML50765.1 dihydrodipicolinate synthase family protein [Neobacillus sp. PS3-12]
MELEKFKGIIPAFYACYDDQGEVSEERTANLCHYLYNKGVKGLYVGGSSGECIYQNIDERKATLKYVAEAVRGKLTLIAHVGAPSTRDSVILAKYAEELGYDALSAIPPIYFKLPESSIYKYWTDIMDSTDLPFIIYNIPQTTGYSLSLNLFKKLIENKKVIGVKNSSMPVMDIERFKAAGGDEFLVFNGPDEQYVSGRLIGADSGIGGTYATMPELLLKANEFVSTGNFADARKVQRDINDIIIALCSLNGNMYSVAKEILKLNGVNVGGVRGPLEPVTGEDLNKVKDIKAIIDNAILKYVR